MMSVIYFNANLLKIIKNKTYFFSVLFQVLLFQLKKHAKSRATNFIYITSCLGNNSGFTFIRISFHFLNINSLSLLHYMVYIKKKYPHFKHQGIFLQLVSLTGSILEHTQIIYTSNEKLIAYTYILILWITRFRVINTGAIN